MAVVITSDAASGSSQSFGYFMSFQTCRVDGRLSFIFGGIVHLIQDSRSSPLVVVMNDSACDIQMMIPDILLPRSFERLHGQAGHSAKIWHSALDRNPIMFISRPNFLQQLTRLIPASATKLPDVVVAIESSGQNLPMNGRHQSESRSKSFPLHNISCEIATTVCLVLRVYDRNRLSLAYGWP